MINIQCRIVRKIPSRRRGRSERKYVKGRGEAGCVIALALLIPGYGGAIGCAMRDARFDVPDADVDGDGLHRHCTDRARAGAMMDATYAITGDGPARSRERSHGKIDKRQAWGWGSRARPKGHHKYTAGRGDILIFRYPIQCSTDRAATHDPELPDENTPWWPPAHAPSPCVCDVGRGK